jgi:pSer/pThr/pTyr-binding forkhead associated (FHA) protein
MWQLQGSDPDVSFRLSAGDIRTIGRATGAQFIIDHPLVSRVHCRVTASDAGTLSVEDLGSTNGTFVNGTRIDRPAQLIVGDALTVGRVTLTVQEG